MGQTLVGDAQELENGRTKEEKERKNLFNEKHGHEHEECIRACWFVWILYCSDSSIQSSIALSSIESVLHTLWLANPLYCIVHWKSDYKECDEFVIQKSML